MATRLRNKVMREAAAAECKCKAVPWETSLTLIVEVAIPTTPTRSATMRRNPVAMFPIGKYIGNIRAGTVRTDAAPSNNRVRNFIEFGMKLTFFSMLSTCFVRSFYAMFYLPCGDDCDGEVEEHIEERQEERRGSYCSCWSHGGLDGWRWPIIGAWYI